MRSGPRGPARARADRLGPGGRLTATLAVQLGVGAAAGRALDRRRDPDLARLDLLRLGDCQLEHAMLERGARLVGLEALGQADRPADRAAADLLDEVLALALLALLAVLAADRERAVLDGDVDVLGLDA